MAELHMARAATVVRLGRLCAGIVALGLGLGAAAAQQALPSGYATQPFTPKGFRLPEGAGCAGDIARWRAIQDNDYASGNVGLKIYTQIQGEIAHAESVCAAGRDGEARALVEGSRRRHGYPG